MPRVDPDLENKDYRHAAHIAHIELSEVQAAYIFLIRFAEHLNGWECYPHPTLSKKQFCYYHGADQPFAFIVNKHHLLFYFRLASSNHPARHADRLARAFGVENVLTNEDQEITVHLASLADAKKLMGLVFSAVKP